MARHSVLPLSGRVGDHRVSGRALVATFVGITVSSDTAVHTSSFGAVLTLEGSRGEVFPVSGLASGTLVTWAESTVGKSTGSTGWSFFWIDVGLEVFTGSALEANVDSIFDVTLHATSDTSSTGTGDGITLDDLDVLGRGVHESLVTWLDFLALTQGWAFADVATGDTVVTSGGGLLVLSSDARVNDRFVSDFMTSQGASGAVGTGTTHGFPILVRFAGSFGSFGVVTAVLVGHSKDHLDNVSCRNGCKQNRFFHRTEKGSGC